MKKLRKANFSGLGINIFRYVFATLMVLLIGALLIAGQGNSPAEAFNAILSGAFGSKRAIGTTIRWMTPTLLTSISAIIAFRSGIWNVGIEGQMYFGAFFCAMVGYEWALPRGLHIVVCLLVAGFAGMLFALIPALAYDREGYRLGYGKGYYDRFLSGFGGTSAGIFYSDLLFNQLPRGFFDRKVSLLVSDRGVILPDA